MQDLEQHPKYIMLDMYVDADFARMWNSLAKEQDPMQVKFSTMSILLLAFIALIIKMQNLI
jgi:hypothetical protein